MWQAGSATRCQLPSFEGTFVAPSCLEDRQTFEDLQQEPGPLPPGRATTQKTGRPEDLRRSKQASTTNWLLQTLAMVDSAFMVTCIVIQPLKTIYDQTDWAAGRHTSLFRRVTSRQTLTQDTSNYTPDIFSRLTSSLVAKRSD